MSIETSYQIIRRIDGTAGEIVIGGTASVPIISIDPSYDPVGIVSAAKGGTGVSNTGSLTFAADIDLGVTPFTIQGQNTLQFAADIDLGALPFEMGALPQNSAMIHRNGVISGVSIDAAFTVLTGQPLGASPAAVTIALGDGLSWDTTVPGIFKISTGNMVSVNGSLKLNPVPTNKLNFEIDPTKHDFDLATNKFWLGDLSNKSQPFDFVYGQGLTRTIDQTNKLFYVDIDYDYFPVRHSARLVITSNIVGTLVGD